MKQKLYLLLLAMLPIVALAESIPTGSGTKEDPFNAVAANAYVKSLDADVVSDADIYIKGTVSSIMNEFTTKYGNATFYISDDGGSDGETFYVYRTLYLGKRDFQEGDRQIMLGDKVVICGKVVNYQGNTPETKEKQSYIYALNGDTGDTPTIDGICYKLNEDHTATVTKGMYVYSGDIAIPSSITNKGVEYTVTAIDGQAFYFNTSISSISIPATVTAIEENAFFGCDGLTAVYINDMSAWCRISFGNGLANPLSSAHRLYLNGSEVRDITINGDVTEIADNAFCNCTSIFTVAISEGVKSIGKSVFHECSTLTKVSLPSTITKIGSGAFYHCKALFYVNLPEGITELEDNTFLLCESLKNLKLPTTLQKIGDGVFGSTAIKKIDIPSAVTVIGDYAFSGCANLEYIYCHPEYVPSAGEHAFDETAFTAATLYVPCANIPAYKQSAVWENFVVILPIPGTEVSIGSGTHDDPFNPFAAIQYIKSLGADVVSEQDIYIKGTIYDIKDEFTARYGNATFSISDYGVKASDLFYVYRTLYLGNRNYIDGDEQIAIGDEVVICGKVKYYQGEVPETVEKASHLYSLKGKTATVSEPTGAGTVDSPFNAAAANAYIRSLTPQVVSENDIYVKGKICAIINEFTAQHGNATFYISDDGTTSGSLFYAYRTSYLGNKKFLDGGTQIQLGDDVVVCGKVILYQGTIPETSENNSHVCSLNGVTYTEVDGLAYYVDTNKQTAEFTGGDSQYSGEVVIPSSITYEGNSYAVTSISSQAFQGCETMTAVTIPGSIVSISEQAFDGCNGLTTITSHISEPFSIYNVFPASILTSATLYVPYMKKAAYQATVGWRDFSNIVEQPGGDVITVTAKSYEREYGEENPTFEYDVTGGTADGNAVITCDATATSPAGTYPVIVSRGDVANTYATFVEGTLTITKAPLTVTAKSYSRKEGEDNPSFELSYSGWKLDETESVLTTLPVATTDATKDSPAGEYVITVNGGSAQNYTFNYVYGTLTIEETSGIVTINGDGNPFDVYTLNGIKVRTQVTSLEGLPKGLYIINGKKVTK